MRSINTLVRKLAGSDLFFLLRGHGLHPEFSAAYSYLATEVRRRARATRGTSLHTVRTWLLSLGWEEAGPWRWSHIELQTEIQWSQPFTSAEMLPRKSMSSENLGGVFCSTNSWPAHEEMHKLLATLPMMKLEFVVLEKCFSIRTRMAVRSCLGLLFQMPASTEFVQ